MMQYYMYFFPNFHKLIPGRGNDDVLYIMRGVGGVGGGGFDMTQYYMYFFSPFSRIPGNDDVQRYTKKYMQ